MACSALRLFHSAGVDMAGPRYKSATLPRDSHARHTIMATSTLSAYAAVLSYPVKSPETLSYTVSWSNLGALTTEFTPPASCNTPLATDLFVQGRTTWAHDCNWTRTADLPRSECYPSYTAPNASAVAGGDNFWLPGEQKFYYSPGYSCPVGWQTATSLTTPAPALVGIWDEGQRPLGLHDAKGTQVFCCPSAWTMGGLAQCYSRVDTSTTLENCREQTRSANHTNRPPATSGTTTTMVAYTTPAVLLYHESASSKGGPNDAGRIAIGVVVPVVVLLAAVLGFLFWRRRRQRRQRFNEAARQRIETSVKERDDDNQSAAVSNTNLGNRCAFTKPELDGSDASRRLLAQTKPELPGSYPSFTRVVEASELADTSIEAASSRLEDSRHSRLQA